MNGSLPIIGKYISFGIAMILGTVGVQKYFSTDDIQQKLSATTTSIAVLQTQQKAQEKFQEDIKNGLARLENKFDAILKDGYITSKR